MSKVDLKRDQRVLYAPPVGRYVEVDVPPMRYLAVDGSGSPVTSPAYREAVEALFAASYAVKFHSKRELDRDYVVLPLEGLWWADDMATFHTREKDKWSWRMLIRQPDWLDDQALTAGIEQGGQRKSQDRRARRGTVPADPARRLVRRRGADPGAPA